MQSGHDAALRVIVLNSGSNGNAVYVESVASGTAILLDCGISRRKIDMRLKIHGRGVQQVSAVFITHEHADHVRGLPILSKLYDVPVYLTEQTYRHLWKHRPHRGSKWIGNDETVVVGDLRVRAFPKSHDACDPVCFEVEAAGRRFLYVTDLGVPSPELIAALPEAHGVMLESNYDEDMLRNGGYPEHLQARIRSNYGHLSNAQAMGLLREHTNGALRTLVLGHLSENNNTPDIVRREVDALLRERSTFRPLVHIASRHDVSEVLHV